MGNCIPGLFLWDETLGHVTGMKLQLGLLHNLPLKSNCVTDTTALFGLYNWACTMMYMYTSNQLMQLTEPVNRNNMLMDFVIL